MQILIKNHKRKKIIFLAVPLLVVAGFALARLNNTVSADNINDNDFVVTVDTTRSGSSSNTQFTIPTMGSGYDYGVDCNNDGVVDAANLSGDYTCNYASPGQYKVRISGVFPRYHTNNLGDRLKLLSIDQWGDIQWTSMEGAFFGANNLEMKATDTPDLSRVISLMNMFRETSVGAAPANWNWDTRNVTNMAHMFDGATLFNQPIDSWNTANVVDMQRMFNDARSFNQPLASWDVSKVTNMQSMFDKSPFNQPIGNWNVSKVENMSYMFLRNTAFNQPIGDWNTASLKYINNMFDGASAFDQPLISWDVTQLEDANWMFVNAGLSVDNYDATLIAWSGQSVRSSVSLNGGSSNYCRAESARDSLVQLHGWSITDAGKDCTNAAATLAPAAAPDLVATADSGDNTDNITDVRQPIFDVICDRAGDVLNLYINGVLRQSTTCAASGTTQIALTDPLSEGTYTISYTATDASGRESAMSPALTITITDSVPSAAPTNMPTETQTETLADTGSGFWLTIVLAVGAVVGGLQTMRHGKQR